MAHEVYNEKFAERADRQLAWTKISKHNWGIDETVLPSEGVDRIGGNVPIVTRPEVIWIDDETKIETGKYAIIRLPFENDPIASFGTVSRNWEPVNYRDFAAMFDAAAKYYRLETMGILKQGALFFLTLAGEGFDTTVNGKLDRNDSYLYAVCYSLPGMANVIGAGAKRVVCANTLRSAIRNARMLMPVTHHQGANAVLRFVGKSLAQLGSSQQALREAYQAMADTPRTLDEATQIFAKTWPIPERPRLLVSLDSLTEQTMELVATPTGFTAPALGKIEDEDVSERRERSEKIYIATCERQKNLRELAVVSLGNMADNQGLGINDYTILQAASETEEWRKGSRGNVPEDLLFGTRAANIDRIVNVMGWGKN